MILAFNMGGFRMYFFDLYSNVWRKACLNLFSYRTTAFAILRLQYLEVSWKYFVQVYEISLTLRLQLG